MTRAPARAKASAAARPIPEVPPVTQLATPVDIASAMIWTTLLSLAWALEREAITS